MNPVASKLRKRLMDGTSLAAGQAKNVQTAVNNAETHDSLQRHEEPAQKYAADGVYVNELEKVAINTRLLKRLQDAGHLPNDVSADRLMRGLRRGDWDGISEGHVQAVADANKKFSPAHAPFADTLDKMDRLKLTRHYLPQELKVPLDEARLRLDKFEALRKDAEKIVGPERANALRNEIEDEIAASLARFHTRFDEGIRALPEGHDFPKELKDIETLRSSRILKHPAAENLRMELLNEYARPFVKTRARRQRFKDELLKGYAPYEELSDAYDNYIAAKRPAENFLRPHMARVTDIQRRPEYKQRIDALREAETAGLQDKLTAAHPNRRVEYPNTVTPSGVPVQGNMYDPAKRVYHGGTLAGVHAPDTARWVSSHPEVSRTYVKQPTDRLMEADLSKIPLDQQGPWSRHVMTDNRGEAAHPLDFLDAPRTNRAVGVVMDESPTYEKVVSESALQNALKRRWKVLPDGGLLELEDFSKTDKHASARQDKDLELWQAYKANPSQMTLTPLMKQLDPVIQVEVNRWAGAIARPVLEAQAKTLALEAIKSYNPNAGAALGTHVTNRLKKLSRKVYTHQDAVRLPEYKKLKVQSLYRANEDLMGVYGREATNQELADHLGWSPKMLSNVQQAQHAELISSEDAGAGMFQQNSVWGSDTDDGMVDMLYFDMDPVDKLIFEHSTGYSGKPILSNTDLRKKTNLTQGQLSYRKRQMVNKIEGYSI